MNLASNLSIPQKKVWNWTWKNRSIQISYQTSGNGRKIFLFPAMSTVSSQQEMAEIAHIFAEDKYNTITVDLPGFGESEKPFLDYDRSFYQAFFTNFIPAISAEPAIVIAAGHTAGYIINIAHQYPQYFSKIILIAPTWRGPLPSMMNGYPSWLKLLRELVRSPILGQFLYYLNTTPKFLSWMYKRHVYSNPANITNDLIRKKRQITQQKNARFAPAAFVTGNLDPMTNRTEFLSCFTSIPTLVIIGKNSPPKSLAEMEAVIGLNGVTIEHLPGTLGLQEEYASMVAEVIKNWLYSNPK